jgi:hypothetical protein
LSSDELGASSFTRPSLDQSRRSRRRCYLNRIEILLLVLCCRNGGQPTQLTACSGLVRLPGYILRELAEQPAKERPYCADANGVVSAETKAFSKRAFAGSSRTQVVTTILARRIERYLPRVRWAPTASRYGAGLSMGQTGSPFKTVTKHNRLKDGES